MGSLQGIWKTLDLMPSSLLPRILDSDGFVQSVACEVLNHKLTYLRNYVARGDESLFMNNNYEINSGLHCCSVFGYS